MKLPKIFRTQEHWGKRLRLTFGDLRGDDRDAGPGWSVQVSLDHGGMGHFDSPKLWNSLDLCLCLVHWGVFVAVRTTEVRHG